MEEIYQRIIESYKETGSVKRTADELGTYPIKVRRVLITEGLWRSRTSDQVAEQLALGKTVPEIAEALKMSEKNVQLYMPYSRGQYGGENRSDEAVRSEAYRERMQTAAEKQVTKTEARPKNKDQEMHDQLRLLEELRAENESLLQQKKEIWDKIEADMKRIPVAIQLHLELDLGCFEDENKEILRKYGRMKEGITRDFIVPGDMTLHALHFAIMRAFGWQNSHLHSYVPQADEFKKMTGGGKVKEWTRLVGVYFRFPGDNYEDIYWDDDYEDGVSIKSWLRSKYCGPYYYEGVGEHYIPAQIEVNYFRKEYPAIQKKTTDQRTWNVIFEGECEELLERSAIWKVLKTPAEHSDWASWQWEKEKLLKNLEKERNAAIKEYNSLAGELERIAGEVEDLVDAEEYPIDDMYNLLNEIERVEEELEALCFEHDPEPIPVLSELLYRYDYGDGWRIRITCTNAWYDRSIYARDEEGNILGGWYSPVSEKTTFADAFDREADENFTGRLNAISEKARPVCIAWDGMNLVEDVGGIDGFCNFLETINGDDPEEKRACKAWAKGLGWTGRMPKPENML